jgi:hypothetical protein
MNLNRSIAIIALALTPFHAFATEEPTYLCVSEEAVGFYYDQKSWGRTHFKVTEDKYIIRKIKESDPGYKDRKNIFGVFPLGGTYPEYKCFINSNSNAYICNIGLGQFLFSPDSGRFISTYTKGYWEGEDNNDNNPVIRRGRCSKI